MTTGGHCCVCAGACWHVPPASYCARHDPNSCDRHRARPACPHCQAEQAHMKTLQDLEEQRRKERH